MAPKTTKLGKAKKKSKVRRIRRPRWPADYIPRVIVKFYVDVELPDEDSTLQEYLEEGKLGPWLGLKTQFSGITMKRLITKLLLQKCPVMVDRAKQVDPTFHPPKFGTYFTVNCPLGADPLALLRVLDSWETVEEVYVESGPSNPPQVSRGTAKYGLSQRYLDPAPEGIDAEYAWTIAGGDGGGANVDLQFIDVEQGWTILPQFRFDHENLPRGIPLIYGENRNWFGHGTSVLSIVVAQDNNTGCVGITPRVATTMVTSIWPDHQTPYRDRPNAILAAIEKLDFGDVLLIEDQVWAYGSYPPSLGGYGLGWYRNLPVEFDDAVFKVIRTATARGIIVVEAAGNGELDLDVFAPQYSTLWGREDSGAIIVAAAHIPAARSNAPYTRLGESNYGNRIACYAWGQQIPTAGDGTNGTGHQDYVQGFGGTSGAAAIIAGAALAVQGIAQANGFASANPKSRFSPGQLRRILSDPSTATASNDPPNDKIGVMPDLRAIITSLQTVPRP